MRRLALIAILGAAACHGPAVSSGDMNTGGKTTGAGGSGMTTGGTGGTTGGAGGSGGSGGAGGSGGTGGVDEPRHMCDAAGKSEVAGPRLLRRLTGKEVDASVRAVFGFDGTQWDSNLLPPDPASINGFTNNVERLTVGEDYARGALDTARKLADLVTGDDHLGRLLPCAPQGDEACASTFLDQYATRLYRRPLTQAERARYLGLHTKVRAKSDFKAWVYWTTMTMMQSPHVLYRSELGEPVGAGKYKLTAHEVSTALAFTFTGAPPSRELIQLASTGKLETADQIEMAARSLVFEAPGRVRPAFREMMASFADQWLGLSPLANIKKDEAAFPQFTAEVQESMAGETRQFIDSVVFDQLGKPADLLTASHTYVDATLAKFYGYDVAPAAGFVKVPRKAGWGLGLLAQGSLLAIEAHSLSTSPTKRGYMIRARILCGEVPPPPDMVDPLPEPTEAETTRKRYEELHTKAASCKGCHELLDPIGFGFEKLDAVGRFRAREGAFDIDDSGKIVNTSAGDVTFRGAGELSQAVARLPEVSDCMASFMASHAFGLDHRQTSCLVRNAADELRAGKISVVDFYIRMARSEHFRTRVQ